MQPIWYLLSPSTRGRVSISPPQFAQKGMPLLSFAFCFSDWGGGTRTMGFEISFPTSGKGLELMDIFEKSPFVPLFSPAKGEFGAFENFSRNSLDQ